MTGDVDGADGAGSAPSAVLVILAGMKALGVDVDAVAASMGSSLAELEARQEYVAPRQLGAMWREGVRSFGKPTLGLHVALAAPTGRLVVEYVAATSATLRQGLEQAVRYQKLVTRNADARLRPEAGRTLYEVTARLPAGIVPPQVIEYAVASSVRHVTLLCGRKPAEAWLPHAPLGPRTEYTTALGIRVRFEAPSVGVLLDDQTLEAPCLAHDPNLFGFLRSHAEVLLERQPRDSLRQTQVRRLVLAQLKDGEPEISRVARLLATSARSLQRQLHAEGTSFREVVDSARQELALAYLGANELTVSDVAYLLGYAEAGAFVRAFKRWTGRTPTKARAQV